MRQVATALLLLALCACGPATPPAATTSDATSTGDIGPLDGRLVALGAGWRFDMDRQLGFVLEFPESNLTFSGSYAAPQTTPNGVRIENGDVALTLQRATCVHEGATYAMSAVVTVHNGSPQQGCAFFRWDRELTALLPQIDACIAQSPRTRRVTYAARQGGDVLVRLHGEPGAFECRVRGERATVSPRDENVKIGGEGDAIFVRAQPGRDPGPQPGGECFDAPEARSADGALLGWMDDPLGC